MQLEEKLRGAARQALADAVMELQLLPASLCTEDTSPGMWGQEPYRSRQDGVSGEGAKVGFWKTSQRPHLKYSFLIVPYLPCVSKSLAEMCPGLGSPA